MPFLAVLPVFIRAHFGVRLYKINEIIKSETNSDTDDYCEYCRRVVVFLQSGQGFALFCFMATICDHRQNSAAGLGGDNDDDDDDDVS